MVLLHVLPADIGEKELVPMVDIFKHVHVELCLL
jgi:hypothetical protein